MKNTSFKIQDVFGDIISKDNFSQEQITKLKKFLIKNNVNININFKFNLFTKEEIKNCEPSGRPEYSDFQ